MLFEIIQLIQCVDPHILNPCSPVQLGPGDKCKHLFRNALCAQIPVMYRILKQIAVLIQKPEVNAPGINANRVDRPVLQRQGNTLLDLKPQTQNIPIHRTV